jgi:cytochrome b
VADPVAPHTRIWDAGVRLLHWTLVLSVAVSWLSTYGFLRFHEPAGYVALAAAVARIGWGFAGGRYARFAQFVRGPRTTWRYARNVVAGTELRYLGHNPLGGWMALALLSCVAALGVTGFAYTTDRFWGEAWLDNLHYGLACVLLALVAIHVAGALFTGARHRENLVAAMITGDKTPAQGDDVA